MGAEVVDRGVGLAIEEDGYKPTGHLKGAALTGRDAADRRDWREGDFCGGFAHAFPVPYGA